MSEKSQALRLINNLLADIREPDFIWQVVALLACIGSALLIARWWRSRHEEGSGRLNDASARLAFPLTGMVLTGIALTTLDNFLNTHLLKLAMPLLGSMALVRGVIFVLRQAFPQATWLTAWERIIAAMVWGWLALYITDLAPYVGADLGIMEADTIRMRTNAQGLKPFVMTNLKTQAGVAEVVKFIETRGMLQKSASAMN